MILKGRVQEKLSTVGGLVIKFSDRRGQIRITPSLAVEIGLARRVERDYSKVFEGIEQDVEIEVRRVDR